MGRGTRQSHDTDDETAKLSVSQRVDKWLWHARIVKTRSLAAEIVEAGKIRRNRERLAKASDIVRIGDVLTITLRSRVLVLRVTANADRRGSAVDAAHLYEAIQPASET
jgi:ribosome-associated heat shock protein Hsp15